MADGATDLSDLLGSSPIQNLPQSTTFSPIVTSGDPFINPVNSGSAPKTSTMSQIETFHRVRYAVKGLLTYVAFFIGAVVVSLSTPRSLILQYIPHTYTIGGVPSYMGAGILGLVATAIAYVLSILFNTLI